MLYELETNKLQSYNNQGYRNETDSFKECLSKRKRLTYSDFYSSKIEIKEIINLDEKAKQSILDDYYKFTKEDIDYAIEHSWTYKEFLKRLKEMGYD